MSTARQRFWMWMLAPVGSVVLSVIYFLVLMPVKASPGELALFERGIGSPLLKVVNGYLGVFFNLRYMGNTSWLALPALALMVVRWKHLQPMYRGVALFLLLAAMVIGGAGGFNYRYGLTLLPAMIAVVMVVTDQGMRRSGLLSKHRMIVHVALVLATVVNSKLSMDLAQRMAMEDPVDKERLEDEAAFYTKFDTGPQNLDGWLAAAGVAPTDRVLVNNLPVYYYTTRRPGLYYWCGSDQAFGQEGEFSLFGGRTDAQVVRYLGDSLDTRYIFSDRNLSRYDQRFEAFLRTHCVLLAEDEKHYTLHALKDTFGR